MTKGTERKFNRNRVTLLIPWGMFHRTVDNYPIVKPPAPMSMKAHGAIPVSGTRSIFRLLLSLIVVHLRHTSFQTGTEADRSAVSPRAWITGWHHENLNSFPQGHKTVSLPFKRPNTLWHPNESRFHFVSYRTCTPFFIVKRGTNHQNTGIQSDCPLL